MLPYHRAARSWTGYRWWKPLVTGVIAVAFYLIFTVSILVFFFGLSFAFPDNVGDPFDALVNGGVVDLSDPVVLLFTLGSVAIMLPALLLATAIMGARPLGLLSSVTGRLRWRWMLRLVVPALLTFSASFALYLLILPPLVGEPLPAPDVSDRTWILLVIVLLLVPLQATAEEYVFRGYLMQTIGGWLRHPLFAILLPVPLFVLGHLYDIWGLLDVAVFGVFAAWLTVRTGGLEAAIVVHVVNNASLFALGAFGLIDMNAAAGSPIGVVVTAGTLALYSWVVLRQARKQSLVVETQPAPAPPVVGIHSHGALPSGESL
ncbi:MAG: family intrarane metalloprotease protein [Homoserinimonas sp.]|nr:family intrarane metalloprotease protein [Homoserinimonas sp.]